MKGLIKFALNTIPRKYLIRLSYIFRKISQYTNKGNNVECPVCNATFRKFLPYGYEQVRENALCPKCLSLERHRLVWIYLRECTSIFERPMKVLHVAPEQCFEERFRNLGNLQYITADLESPLANYKCDIQKMPFGKDEFDMVICNHVLEHVDSDKRALSEILRVLKPGGQAILLVPIDFNLKVSFEDESIKSAKDRKLHFGQYDHQRLYGLDFPERLRQAGFVIPEKNYLDEIPEEKRLRYGLPKIEFMYGYQKPKIRG
jgi:SAM-dependent methyltransferase